MNPQDRLLAKIRERNPELCVEDAFLTPAWFAPQELWVKDHQNSNSAVYNHPLGLRFQGALQISALEESIGAVVRRHHALRSVFSFVDGKLVQIIVPPGRINVPFVDLSQFGEQERESQARKLILEDAGRAFDFANGPLLRAIVLRLGPADHVLALTTHHLVCDDWSTGILVRELATLYNAFTRKAPLSLPDLQFQYGDFVRWLEKQLDGEKLETRISFWRGQLAGGDSFHHLRPNQPRPPKQSFRGAEQKRILSEDLIASLRLLSQRERASLFMTMLAAWQCLLHRVSGATHIAVGSCAANRPLAEVEGLIGRFGNDLVLRTDLSGNPTFQEVIGRVRETALTAYSYQDVPFAELVKRLDSARDPSRNPLFQVMFIMQDAPKQGCEFPGLNWSWFTFDVGTAKYDLNVWLKIRGGGLEIAFEYNTDLFETATISHLLRNYHGLLQAVVADPGKRVAELPLECGSHLAGQQPACLPEKQPSPSDDVGKPGPSMAFMVKELRPALGDSPRMGQWAEAASNPNEFMIRTPLAPDPTATDPIESQVLKIWEVGFKKPVTIDDDFFQLGGDSLLAAWLFAQIEKRFKISLPLAALFTVSTIRGIANMLRKVSPATQWPSLVAVQPQGWRPPLFCTNGVSGDILYCGPLAGDLGSDQPIFGLQSRGLTGPPHLTIPDMARDYIKEVRSVQPRGPYHLCGHCFGGWVAYEMARQLQAQGEEVSFLGLINTPVPSCLHRSPSEQIRHVAEKGLLDLKNLGNLPTTRKWDFLRRRFVVVQQMVARSNTAAACRRGALLHGNGRRFLPKWILDVSAINLHAAKKYVPEKYSGQVTLFLSEHARPLLYSNAIEGWRALAGGGLEIHTLPGADESALVEPYRLVMAEKMKACLEKAQATASAAR